MTKVKSSQEGNYQIQRGDTLSGIAKKVGTEVSDLMQLNPQIRNANRIFAGQSLRVNHTLQYTVRRGDTMSGIAQRNNTTLRSLMAANPEISNANRIFVGQRINLPRGSRPQSTIPTTNIPQTQNPTPTTRTTPTQNTPPTTQTTSNYGTVNLDSFLDSRRGSDALAAVVIGNAEGNRTPSGGFTRNYGSHIDPGDGKVNRGSFSYNPRGSGRTATSPQEADRIYLGVLQGHRAAYEAAARRAGLDPNNAMLASTYFDAATQSPSAAARLLNQMDYVKQNGISPQTMTEWRVRGFINPQNGERYLMGNNGGRAGSGFANVFRQRNNGAMPTEQDIQNTIRQDQARRVRALHTALVAQGLGANPTTSTAPTTTPPVTTRPQPVPTTPVNIPARHGAVDTVLPSSGPGFTTYNRERNGADQYATSRTIGLLRNVAAEWNRTHPNNPIQIGDLSRRGGGEFSPHSSHQRGTNADFRPFRLDGRQAPVTWRDSNYDRNTTRELIRTIKAQNPNAVILFNDPVLIREGLARPYSGHDNHLHVTFR